VPTFSGDTADNVLNGTSSADTMSGLAGRDTISGGDGDDTIYGFGPTDIPGGDGTLLFTQVGSGFINPVYAASAPGDPNTLYVVEQHTGSIRQLDLTTGAINSTPFLDLPDSMLASGGEQGLLGLAFDPDYAANGKLYIYITNASGNNEVWQYTRAVSGVADPASASLIMRFSHSSASNHNAGWMAFGPDGFLYIASGDGGGGNDQFHNAQNTSAMLGKLLRIDVSGGDDFPGDANHNYKIPAANPFGNAVWVYGLRNPWRNSFDPATGDLYIGDVGQGAREEIDYLPAGSPGGTNFGWAMREGFIATPNRAPVAGEPSANDPALVDPIVDYGHSISAFGGFAEIGGYVYRGPAPGAQGVYFFADEVSNQLWTLHVVDGAAQDFDNRNSQIVVTLGGPGLVNPSSFALDGSKNLYVITLGGSIYRIDPSADAADSADQLFGGLGNDLLYGGIGGDIIEGGLGADNLGGGLGDDTLSGGGGLDRATYSGARAAYTLTHNVDGSWTVAGPEGTDTLTTVERLMFSDQTVVIRASPVADFSGEGNGDFLWQNTTTSQAVVWLMNGTSVTSGSAVGGAPGAGWVVKGSGDFNGDGKSDILWQNTNTRQAVVWLMNGLSVTTGSVVGGTPNAGWQVIGSGDFDGDTKSDILWQNTITRQAAVWVMNGLSVTGGSVIGGAPNPGWVVKGSGDFNGDGKSDILWQNTTTRQAAVWLMNGLGVTSGNVIGSAPNAGWVVKGSGDFDGDGKSDILWQNANTRQAAVWLMNGLTVTGGGVVGGTPNAGWNVVGAADTDGDGKSDILWQNTNGQALVWLMNGLAVTSAGNVGSNPGPAWHLIGPGG
jgi:glucose/arabinose dehydrogenase